MRIPLAAAFLALAGSAGAQALARAAWPLKAPFTVMNTIATLQYYGDQPGFHHGVDLRAAAGSKVYAPVSGAVGAGYYYPRHKIPYAFMVSIDADDGRRWELHHVDPASLPQDILGLVARHGRVEAGTLLAEVYDTAKAPQLNVPPHLHVDLMDSQGVRHDALGLFPPLADPRVPEIRGIYLVGPGDRAVAGAAGGVRRPTLPPGTYDLVVDALETVSAGTAGDAPYALEVLASGRAVGSLLFERLPDADYLKGVDAVYRLKPFAGLDGAPVENRIDTEAPRRFLFRFPFNTADFGARGDIPLEVRVRNRAGGESRAELRLSLASR